MMEQKIAIALVLLVGCSLLLYGCTGAGGTQNQGPTQPSPQNGQGGQVGAQGPSQNGAPTGNGIQYQPTTGIASLSDNDTSVATGDNDGSGYTDLPVDDGTDAPVNGS